MCLGYPYTLFACFLALHPYIFIYFYFLFFIDLYQYNYNPFMVGKHVTKPLVYWN